MNMHIHIQVRGGGGSRVVGSTTPGDSEIGTSTGVSELRPPAAPVLIAAELGTAGGAVEGRLVVI